jgi:hypothetical protein
MMSDLIRDGEAVFEEMKGVHVAIVQIFSLRAFLKKCKFFYEWMTGQGKIVFLVSLGDNGCYLTDPKAEVNEDFDGLGTQQPVQHCPWPRHHSLLRNQQSQMHHRKSKNFPLNFIP